MRQLPKPLYDFRKPLIKGLWILVVVYYPLEVLQQSKGSLGIVLSHPIKFPFSQRDENPSLRARAYQGSHYPPFL